MRIAICSGELGNVVCRHLTNRGVPIDSAVPPYPFWGDDTLDLKVIQMSHLEAGLYLPTGRIEASVSDHGQYGFVSDRSCWSSHRKPGEFEGGKQVRLLQLQMPHRENTWYSMPVWIFNGLPSEHEALLIEWLIANLSPELSRN